jgi:hypothetical protein
MSLPRQLGVYEGIRVAANSHVWLTKYRSSLGNQTLEIRSNKSMKMFNRLQIVNLYRVFLFKDQKREITQIPILPKYINIVGVRNYFPNLADAQWLSGLKGFDFGDETYTQKEITAILEKLGSELTTLTMLSPKFDLDLCPVFPKCASLFWNIAIDQSLTKIQDKFPALVSLHLNAYEDDTGFGISSLEPLRGSKLESLVLASSFLSDLSPLSNVPLIYLDVGYCDRIVDFSHVDHVTIVKKHK